MAEETTEEWFKRVVNEAEWKRDKTLARIQRQINDLRGRNLPASIPLEQQFQQVKRDHATTLHELREELSRRQRAEQDRRQSPRKKPS